VPSLFAWNRSSAVQGSVRASRTPGNRAACEHDDATNRRTSIERTAVPPPPPPPPPPPAVGQNGSTPGAQVYGRLVNRVIAYREAPAALPGWTSFCPRRVDCCLFRNRFAARERAACRGRSQMSERCATVSRRRSTCGLDVAGLTKRALSGAASSSIRARLRPSELAALSRRVERVVRTSRANALATKSSTLAVTILSTRRCGEMNAPSELLDERRHLRRDIGRPRADPTLDRDLRMPPPEKLRDGAGARVIPEPRSSEPLQAAASSPAARKPSLDPRVPSSRPYRRSSTRRSATVPAHGAGNRRPFHSMQSELRTLPGFCRRAATTAALASGEVPTGRGGDRPPFTRAARVMRRCAVAR